MENLLERCIQGRSPIVLVVGDVMCDSHLFGQVSRISPEAPVPVFECMERRYMLGGAANVAANLQILGCDVRLISVIGTDDAGLHLRELLHKQGIADAWLVRDDTRPTTEKIRLLAHHQHVLRLDQESRKPLERPLASQVVAHAQALMGEVDAVICSDYQKGVCTTAVLEPLFAQARDDDRPIIVDPKMSDFAFYRGATVLTPNLKEVERASGMVVDSEEALEQAADLLLYQSQAQALLVTRSEEGMSLFSPPQAPVRIPALAREVYDVTGAGDTVMATLSMGICCGLSLEEAARLANTAAGIVVGKLGTAVVYPEELRATLRTEEGSRGRKVLRRDELIIALQSRRQRGERIVFTNGCFDLLHVGHIAYLQEAAALGDCLVVGVNDDDSVRLLKGAKRPLIGQEERSRVLAALACVDYVTIFSEPTPLDLIKLARPDVLYNVPRNLDSELR